jgi:lipopolysaccharide/colanic/teichoic acid biosynthesis glycosyltransferase
MSPNQRTETRRVTRQEALQEDRLFEEQLFARMILVERKRTERSRRAFVLMLADVREVVASRGRAAAVHSILSALAVSTRDTDLLGWYENGAVIGVIFTEIGTMDRKSVVAGLHSKIISAFEKNMTAQQVGQIDLSFHVFPDDWEGDDSEKALRLYLANHKAKRLSLVVKRAIDITGSLLALMICLPVLLVIAAAIRATSRGPVLFRQARIGQYGTPFTFLKFRSMRVDNDPAIHEEFVKRFIAGQNGMAAGASCKPIYKITADPRVTPIGRFLRRSSLDELPQLLNVLMGEMSLVGPRPPIPYEFQSYDLWHRSRMLETKPGITGLWQVEGRSRVTFDEMVRLDLRYARSWSLWLDLKILLRTPKAVFQGAY